MGPGRFAKQASLNQAWNHVGNVIGAGGALGLALLGSLNGVFWLIIVMAAGMVACSLAIHESEIDHDMARGGVADTGSGGHQPSGFRTLLTDRRLIIFAICIVLFHFSNAAMLPLIGQHLSATGSAGEGIVFTSGCIIVAQIVMVPMALLCGAKAETWGRKTLFLAAFMVLPLRGVLYTVVEDAWFLVAVQALDGFANGIFGVLFLLILADLTQGTGRFNVAQGALTTLVGIGASCSNLIAGWIVELGGGYHAGFLFLAGVAVLGIVLFAVAMPETAPHKQRSPAPATG